MPYKLIGHVSTYYKTLLKPFQSSRKNCICIRCCLPEERPKQQSSGYWNCFNHSGEVSFVSYCLPEPRSKTKATEFRLWANLLKSYWAFSFPWGNIAQIRYIKALHRRRINTNYHQYSENTSKTQTLQNQFKAINSSYTLTHNRRMQNSKAI